MINVLNSVKTKYKSDSITKKYFFCFRDYGTLKDNTQIKSESLQITESICSAGSFKVGLCESASCKVSMVLDRNVNEDELTVFQVLGEFEPEILNPLNDSDNIMLTGNGVEKLNTTFTATNIISGLDTDNFSKDENYLVLAKLKYIGNPIYLYVETDSKSSRMVYYLKNSLFNFNGIRNWSDSESYNEGMTVLHNGLIWQSTTFNNTTEPGSLVDGELINTWKNITRYVQVAIPIIGSEFSQYKKAVYVSTDSEYGTLEGIADIYKLDYPIMPLGLFTVKSCKKTNDSRIRNIEAYDRMQDVRLDTDVYFTSDTSSSTWNTRIGQVLDKAAENTQIIIGNNLSTENVTPEIVTQEEETITEFPQGTIYKVVKNEEQIVQGTYSEVQNANCSLDYTRTEQKTLDGTYVNGGNYSHTQMQIIDGTLNENATSSNKEFSTVIRKTIKSAKYVDADDKNWDSYININGANSAGFRLMGEEYYRTGRVMQTQIKDTCEQRYSKLDNPYSIISGKERPNDSSNQWTNFTNRIYHSLPGDIGGEHWYTYEELQDALENDLIRITSRTDVNYDWNDTTTWKYKENDRITYNNLTYRLYKDGIGTSWIDEPKNPPANPQEGDRRWLARTETFSRYVDWGYYYGTALDKSWSIEKAEYYTEAPNKQGYVTENNTPIKEYAYIDVYKTYYWKYDWASLPSKTNDVTAWVAYGSKYQSQSYSSNPKYSVASERPSARYTSLNKLYTDAPVYNKMSMRYTRTHTYDYTFSNAGTGWSVHKNINADAYNNYLKNSTNSNKVYTGVTLADQRKVGLYSDKTVYNSLSRDYRKSVLYGYEFDSPQGDGWIHSESDYNDDSDRLIYSAGRTIDGITYLEDIYNTKWRKYTRKTTYTWEETAVLKRITYKIPDDLFSNQMQYTVYSVYPTDTETYKQENKIKEYALENVGTVEDAKTQYSSEGVLEIDRQSDIQNAIIENTVQTIHVDSTGKFEIYWILTLTYTGKIQYNGDTPIENNSQSGIIYASNPYQNCIRHNIAEKFNGMPIECVSQTVHGTRRSIIASFMELHGLFINFDRWGVSTTRNVVASTLYPSEELYPHDSTLPGLSTYGDIYPTLGSEEIADASICKSIYIDDDINTEFNGVLISKSNLSANENGLYPFYYNRQNRRYGALPSGMPEIAHTPWEGNNYYEIKNNFFFDNFIFTENQLKEICKNILQNIGNLQYFNLTAQLRALPYMEVGDSINIMTPQNGYETVILKRVMKGNSAQMDSIETDFY